MPEIAELNKLKQIWDILIMMAKFCCSYGELNAFCVFVDMLLEEGLCVIVLDVIKCFRCNLAVCLLIM